MKKNNPVKNILNYIPVLTIAIGLIAGWVKISMSSEESKAKISELKSDVKEITVEGDKKIEDLKDRAKETEKKVEINKTQQDNIQAQVQQVSEKTDKIYDVLLELKNKKK